MTSNYYTLKALAKELEAALRGAEFSEGYSMRADELRLRFSNGTSVVALLRPIGAALFFQVREEHKPKKNVQQFFQTAEGQAVTSVSIEEHDRIIKIELTHSAVHLHYFGKPNALLRNGEKIISSFRSSGPERPRRRRVEGVPKEVTNCSDWLDKNFPMFGKHYRAEFFARFGLDANGLVGDENKLQQAASEFDQLLRTSRNAIVYRGIGDRERGGDMEMRLLSLIDLASETEDFENFNSVNDAVRDVLLFRERQTRSTEASHDLLRDWKLAHDRLARRLEHVKQGASHSAKSDEYYAIGDAIVMASPEKGSESAVIILNGIEKTIEIDPHLSSYENAAKYYEKAKLAKKRMAALAEEVHVLTTKLERLIEVRAEIEKEEADKKLIENDKPDKKTIERIGRELKSYLPNRQSGPGPMEAPQEKFRKYTVFGGMTVRIGRNAKQNDELTSQYAKKEDLWLHARGVPGSHVVLERGTRKDIPKEAIEEAAELAAYYSDARSQSLAPVIVTPRKFVRRPKGAAPGEVKVEREEVVLVRPQIRIKN